MNYNKIRRKTHAVKIGRVSIGGDNPIAIQSMTNTDTHDIPATLAQIRALAAAGCDIVRVTVPDVASAAIIPAVHEAGIEVPIVADIHFDYRVALACADFGVDKIRINPETSEMRRGCARWRRHAVGSRFPFGLASTAARWKSIFSPNTENRHRRRFVRVHCSMRGCLKNMILRTL